MAEVTIRLQVDPATGKKTVHIAYKSDESALPMEHEQDHRAIVDKLIEGGVLKASELGRVIVTRDEETRIAEPQRERVAEAERASVKQG